MIGNKVLFKTLFKGKIGIVTYGDGSKSVIRGIGIVDIPGLPFFEDVWYCKLATFSNDQGTYQEFSSPRHHNKME